MQVEDELTHPASNLQSPAPAKLTRRVLESLPLTPIHRARNWSKADVSELEWPPGSGERVVVKDFKNRPRWFRILAARPMLRREARALRALKDVEGVPKLVAYPDADCIVQQKMPGIQLQEIDRHDVDEETVVRLDALVAEIHERGVTHGDLHHENILVQDGQVALIDWATAAMFPQKNRGLRGWLFEEFQALDLRAVAKVKLFYVRRLSQEDYDLLENGSRAYRSVKKLRHALDRIRGKKRTDRVNKLLDIMKSKRANDEPAGLVSREHTSEETVPENEHIR
jgi:tRNA A-37 threonylcarbamoyl transferase component Bud32